MATARDQDGQYSSGDAGQNEPQAYIAPAKETSQPDGNAANTEDPSVASIARRAPADSYLLPVDPESPTRTKAPRSNSDSNSRAASGSLHPPASNASAGAAARVRRRNRMIQSCLECRRRKLKCDKSQPCANCTKFSRECVFLAQALDSASQLKLTEIKEKMGSLEKVLEQDVARNGAWREMRRQYQTQAQLEPEVDFAPIPDDEKELEPSPLSVTDAVYEDDADDDLMDLGIALGKLRLTERVGGFVRPKIAEEFNISLTDKRNDRRSEAEKQLSPEPPVPSPGAFKSSFFAPGPSYIPPSSSFFFAASGASLMDFLPARSAADRLLEHYWISVHPMAHVVHRPSFQRRYDTFWNEVQLGIEPVGSLQAVVFAAMFSAVVSMSDELITKTFSVPKKDLIENFQQGVEMALGQANLLRTTKVEVMQALVMYLIALCGREISRAHSVLVGTGIRLAECMGLHRDGSFYGLTPLETHVRRLIWYHLCLLDLRTCEVQGPRPAIRDEDFDTKLPFNVNDADFEKSILPKPSANHFTDMTATLIRFECAEMTRTIWFDRIKLEKKQLSLTAALGKVENFRRICNEKYLPMFDDAVPLQHATHLAMSVLITRMYTMILHRYHIAVAFPIPDRLRQILLTMGTQQMESAMAFETLPEIQPWFWVSGIMQQWHTALVLLMEVFAFPMRREADRIWKVLDYVFEPPLHLSRDAKARLIITELRDRSALYQQLRKMRAPTIMTRRLGVTPPRAVPETESHPLVTDVGATGGPKFAGVPMAAAMFSGPTFSDATALGKHSSMAQNPQSSSSSASPPSGMMHGVSSTATSGPSPYTSHSASASSLISNPVAVGPSANTSVSPPPVQKPTYPATYAQSQPVYATSAIYPPPSTTPSQSGPAAPPLSGLMPSIEPDLLAPSQQQYSAAPNPKPKYSAASQSSFAPVAATSAPAAGSPRSGTSPSLLGNLNLPPEHMINDDLMAEIDWNEWDKLFPPDINTGDLNLPSHIQADIDHL